MNNKKQIIIEGKIFEGISPLVKKLIDAFLSGKIKKISVSKENKPVINSFKDIGTAFNKIDDFIEDHPEIKKELEDKFGW